MKLGASDVALGGMCIVYRMARCRWNNSCSAVLDTRQDVTSVVVVVVVGGGGGGDVVLHVQYSVG